MPVQNVFILRQKLSQQRSDYSKEFLPTCHLKVYDINFVLEIK